MQINFGKYKGQHVDGVIKNDPAYCQWVAKNMTLKRPDLVAYIIKNMDISSVIINFGIHKGRSLRYLREKDPKYVQWMAKSDWIRENRPDILHELFIKYPDKDCECEQGSTVGIKQDCTGATPAQYVDIDDIII